MEFRDVLRRRKMVRTFRPEPLDPAAVDRILEAGRRAPSAGFAQGFAFLVFEGPEETARFWEAATEGARDKEFGPGLRAAPLVVVPLTSKRAYLDRYAEDDKGWTDRDEARWSAPYWTVDAAFASMLILLAAVDEGLGALFFGLFPPEDARTKFRRFGVPAELEPVGAIVVGRPGEDRVRSSRDTRRRKPFDEVVHRGGAW